MYLSDEQIEYIKDTLVDPYTILADTKVNSKHGITMYQGDTIIGYVAVDSAIDNRISYTNSEFNVTIEINYNLRCFLDSLTNIDNIDCNDSYKFVSLDTLPVKEFIDLLIVNNPIPQKFYKINVRGRVDSNWITKKDIAYMIPMMKRTDRAYCVGSPSSSMSFIGDRDYATLGGHIINLIDYYRFDKISPIYYPTCFKNDIEKQKEILDWWENEKNN